MKLLRHIIKKDIGRERWALALWALLFVAQIGVGAWVLWDDAADFKWLVKAQTWSVGLMWLQMGMGYVLIARWVHADALLGTKEFWLTRPVSGARLLAAKVTGVVLVFGFGPVLILLPWWLVSGFGATDVLWTAGQTLGWQLVMILPALVIASVTDDLGRVLLGTLVLVLAVAVWTVLWQLLPGAKAVGGVAETRMAVAVIIAVAGIAGIVVQQFLTRRWVRSLAMGVACVGVVCAVAQLWPWDWTTRRGETERVAEKAELKFGGAEQRVASGVDLSWRLEGAPDGMGARVLSAKSTWRWADGPALTKEARFFSQDGGAPSPFGAGLVRFDDRSDPETFNKKIEAAEEKIVRARQRGVPPSILSRYEQGLAKLVAFPGEGRDLPGRGYTMVGGLEVSPSLVERMRTTASQLEATLNFSLVRAEVLAEMAWKEGSRVTVRGTTLRLTGLEVKPGGTGARLVVSQASRQPLLTVLNIGTWDLETGDREYRRGRLVAVNRVQGDRVDVQTGSRESAVIGGVVLSWRKLTLVEPWVLREGKRVPRTKGWLEGATVALVAEKELGRFTKEARVDGFLLAK